jgi:hypothetical protein
MSTSSSNPYASPATPVDADPTIEAGVWRDGDWLVVRSKRHALPNRCVVCNAASVGRNRRVKFSWLNDKQRGQAIAVLILLGPWMYLFARTAAQTARIRVGLCRRHLRRRRRALLIGWTSLPLAVAAIAYCAQHGIGDFRVLAAIAVAGIAGVLYGVYSFQLLKTARIDRGFVWLDGVAPEFLAEIPDIPQEQ